MRKASTLIGLMLIALGTNARAEDHTAVSLAPAAAVVNPIISAPPRTDQPRWRVSLSFLPMGFGLVTTPIGNVPTKGEAEPAYGFGLTAGYRVIAGLSVGIAPQFIYNVAYKTNPNPIGPTPAVHQIDLMARLAYTFPIVETIGLYLEALPGYSLLAESGGGSAKGFVVGFGGGVDMNVTNRIFATLGVGYQLGFQSVVGADGSEDARTRYARVNLGGGVQF